MTRTSLVFSAALAAAILAGMATGQGLRAAEAAAPKETVTPLLKTDVIGAEGLVATSGPALAAVTISCKNPVAVSGGILPGTAQAKSYAKSKWVQATTNKYGPVWANFSKAKFKHYTCKKVKGGKTCGLSARPCSQVGTSRSVRDDY